MEEVLRGPLLSFLLCFPISIVIHFRIVFSEPALGQFALEPRLATRSPAMLPVRGHAPVMSSLGIVRLLSFPEW